MLNNEAKYYIYLVIFIFTFVFPVAFIPFFIYWKKISGIQMHDKKERQYPLAVGILFFGICNYLFAELPIPKIISSFIFAALITLIADFILNNFIKISLHMSGIAGVLAMVIFVSMQYNVNLIVFIIIVVFISGILGTARLLLNAHNIGEISAGFLTGFFISYLSMFIYMFI
ncbi:MAG: hypothetical protein Kow0068_12710 [Marinilabiliales bacterium]